jgi:hypothetical protein
MRDSTARTRPVPMERPPVARTCTHADGTVLGWAYHGLKPKAGYVRTPFHGGRVAGWKLVNSLIKVPIKSTDRVGGRHDWMLRRDSTTRTRPHRPRVGGRHDWVLRRCQ